MRKVSKSRVDEDGVSSTNGSIANDNSEQDANGSTEPALSQVNDESEPANTDSEGDTEEKNGKESPVPKDPPKKRGSKSRARKKEKKEAQESDNEKDEEQYEVEKIISSKKIRGELHYLIRWKGYSAANDTWEAEGSVSCPDLIKKFTAENPDLIAKEEKATKRKLTGKKSKNAKAKGSPAKKVKKNFDFENADTNEEYEVEKILEVHHKKNGNREFLIHWKGWSSKFDSWEPEEHLNCKDLIKKFMEKVQKAKGTDSRALRVAPKTTDRFTLQQQSSGRRLSKRGNQRQRVRYDDAE